MLDDFGAVNVLVNNAEIAHDATFVNMTKAYGDAVLRTDLDVLFNMTKPFITGMVERGCGRIINRSVNGRAARSLKPTTQWRRRASTVSASRSRLGLGSLA